MVLARSPDVQTCHPPSFASAPFRTNNSIRVGNQQPALSSILVCRSRGLSFPRPVPFGCLAYLFLIYACLRPCSWECGSVCGRMRPPSSSAPSQPACESLSLPAGGGDVRHDPGGAVPLRSRSTGRHRTGCMRAGPGQTSFPVLDLATHPPRSTWLVSSAGVVEGYLPRHVHQSPARVRVRPCVHSPSQQQQLVPPSLLTGYPARTVGR